MKKVFYSFFAFALAMPSFAQEEETTEKEHDTTRLNFGKIEVLVVESNVDEDDTTIIRIDPKKVRHNVAHWAGIDFGFNVLMNNNGQNSFSSDKFLTNDIAHSQVWNINFAEHKFKIIKEYVGLTTGLGLHFTQIAFKNNYVLSKASDSTYATIDTLVNYDKNKLKAAYLTLPLLLEFNTHKNNHNGFYLAAGVVGGLRISSRYKRIENEDGQRNKIITKGDYNLSPLKLDLLARFGYKDFGGFVSYALMPIFEKGSTTEEAFPLTAGITLNF